MTQDITLPDAAVERFELPWLKLMDDVLKGITLSVTSCRLEQKFEATILRYDVSLQIGGIEKHRMTGKVNFDTNTPIISIDEYEKAVLLDINIALLQVFFVQPALYS